MGCWVEFVLRGRRVGGEGGYWFRRLGRGMRIMGYMLWIFRVLVLVLVLVLGKCHDLIYGLRLEFVKWDGQVG